MIVMLYHCVFISHVWLLCDYITTPFMTEYMKLFLPYTCNAYAQSLWLEKLLDRYQYEVFMCLNCILILYFCKHIRSKNIKYGITAF